MGKISLLLVIKCKCASMHTSSSRFLRSFHQIWKHYPFLKSTCSTFSTPKPEDKREHLRDTRPGICRPLTLGHGPEAVIEQAAGELTTSSYPPVIVATSCLDETDGHQQIAENEEEIEAPDFEVVAEPRKRRQLPSIEHLKGNSLVRLQGVQFLSAFFSILLKNTEALSFIL